jgi:hypothetical protein
MMIVTCLTCTLSFGFVFGSKESQQPQSCRAALSKFNNFRSEAQILVIFIIIIFLNFQNSGYQKSPGRRSFMKIVVVVAEGSFKIIAQKKTN